MSVHVLHRSRKRPVQDMPASLGAPSTAERDRDQNQSSMRRHHSFGVLAGIAAILVLATVCLSALVWHLQGGRWFVVRTPSMGQAAPVGTLLLTQPVAMAAVHVGDIVSFHPPGSAQTYTHRVISESAAGLRTRGDINSSADPWVLTQQNLIGKVTHRWWGIGWIARGLPLLLICLAIIWLITAFLPQSWRSPVRLSGAALSVAVTTLVLHPWIGLQQLDASGGESGTTVRMVSTGILPVRVSGDDGHSVRLLDGEVGRLLITQPASDGGYRLTPSLSLSFGWWVAVILISLIPLAWTLLVGLAPVPVDSDEHSPRDEDGPADPEAARTGENTDGVAISGEDWLIPNAGCSDADSDLRGRG